jgi:hypothetical protein
VSSHNPEGNTWIGLGTASIMAFGLNYNFPGHCNAIAPMIRHFREFGSENRLLIVKRRLRHA